MKHQLLQKESPSYPTTRLIMSPMIPTGICVREHTTNRGSHSLSLLAFGFDDAIDFHLGYGHQMRKSSTVVCGEVLRPHLLPQRQALLSLFVAIVTNCLRSSVSTWDALRLKCLATYDRTDIACMTALNNSQSHERC